MLPKLGIRALGRGFKNISRSIGKGLQAANQFAGKALRKGIQVGNDITDVVQKVNQQSGGALEQGVSAIPIIGDSIVKGANAFSKGLKSAKRIEKGRGEIEKSVQKTVKDVKDIFK